MGKWKEANDSFKAEKEKRKKRTEEQNNKNKEKFAEIEKKFKTKVANANQKASEKSNALREAMGALPLAIDVATVEEAQAKLDSWICKDKDGSVTEVETDMVSCAAPPAKERRLVEGDCAENVWTNPDPLTETTADKAVQAWYD